ncbi:MAG: hypothetical protein ACI88H_003176 [Cocleimonas sp.]|jgi:hypothetical protein
MPKKHSVSKNDCISSIAYKYGFLPEKIWDYEDNRELKNKRKSMYLLCPGDVVIIPDIEIKQEIVNTDQKHTFVRKGVPEVFKLCLLDKNNIPKVNVSYRLDLDGHLLKGKTDASGYILENIPPNAAKGILMIEDNNYEESIELSLGALNPILEITGIQHRLNNLGYDCGDEDGAFGPHTLMAMNDFQIDNKLTTTEQIDNETLVKIEQCYTP